MQLTDEDCYRALQARDTRFDGSFFVCVESTGIYCRPVCPARTPRRDRCRFVRTAAAAAEAGFRPCLRCRPETAPGSPAWLGSHSTVNRALALLHGADDDNASIDAVAAELGITPRQLHRLFVSRLGASPKAVAQTTRLAVARQLLLRSACSMTDVALASGFRSVRRFNGALKQSFGMTPTELRLAHGGRTAGAGDSFRLALAYRPPYAWHEMLEYFRMRAVAGLEHVDETYTRSVRVGDAVGTVRVGHEDRQHRLVVEFRLDKPANLGQAVRRLRELFDVDAYPQQIADQLAQDARMRTLVARYPGLRIPGCWDVFETVVRAVIGQQVSVKAATTVLGRLVSAYGQPLPDERTNALRLFPRPPDLCGVDLRVLGLNRARAATIERVAQLFADDPSFVHPAMDDEEASARLRSVAGIGPWTANYVRLRALRNPDAFPDADLGALKATGTSNARELAAVAEAWRPWRGYALLYLWKSLSE